MFDDIGNWLRDYSQAMDIAGLSKLSKQTILNLVSFVVSQIASVSAAQSPNLSLAGNGSRLPRPRVCDW